MRHDDLLGPVDRRLRVVALDEAVVGQEHPAVEFDGLLAPSRSPSCITLLRAEQADRVVALRFCDQPGARAYNGCPTPGETTHWTGPLMPKAVALRVSSDQRI